MISSLKFSSSPEKTKSIELVRQSIDTLMMDEQVNEKAIKLAKNISDDRYEAQIKELKQRIQDYEEQIAMVE